MRDFILKLHLLTKTGSGQTQGKARKSDAFSLGDCGGSFCTGAAAIRFRGPLLVRYIRSQPGHLTTPIFMAAGTNYAVDWIGASGGSTQHASYSEALADAVASLRSDGYALFVNFSLRLSRACLGKLILAFQMQT